MRNPLPGVAAAALMLSATAVAAAEETAPASSHPADTTIADTQPNTIDPFALAVPLTGRAVPKPSYWQGTPTTDAESMPDAAASMDHSNMPGMSGN